MSFDKYSFRHDKHFKFAWYDSYDIPQSDFKKDKLLTEFQEENWKELYSKIIDNMPIANNDKVEVGDWLLCFIVNEKFRALKSGMVWHSVDKVVPNSLNNKQFPSCSFQTARIKYSEVPFYIDDKFKNVFVKVINQDRFKIFREYNSGKDSWLVKKTIPYMQDFISALKKEYSKK
jgi:hypothetical protein